jgi:hypothetical protein
MSYDASLLASAPKATKAMVQEGYNPHILDESKSKSAVIEPAQLEAASPREPPLNSQQNKPKLPFYRTRTGIITIVIITLVILGAVIGGAVGGTRHSSSHAIDSTSSAPASSTSATLGGGQGVQGAGSTTTTTTGTTTGTATGAPATSSQANGGQSPVTLRAWGGI